MVMKLTTASEMARRWTVSNLGMDPDKTDISELYEAETAEFVDEEYAAWLRIAKAAEKYLASQGILPTHEEMEKASSRPEISKRYVR